MAEYIERSDALKVIETASSMVSSLLEATMKLCVTMDRIAAADVSPVRHGRWIAKNADGSWRVDTCSVCNKDTHYVRFASEYDFCPNCGANMKDGDGE